MEKCSRSNSPAAYSTSTTAATRGTSSPIGLGSLCPSACETGPTGSNQRDLVLVVHRSGVDPLRMERVRMCCGVGTEVVSVLVLRVRCLV